MSEILRRAADALRSATTDGLTADIDNGHLRVRHRSGEARFPVLDASAAVGSSRVTKERAAQLVSRRRPNEPAEAAGSLLVAEAITEAAASLLRRAGRPYLDAAGNCYLDADSLLVMVRGETSEHAGPEDRPIRAFNASGLRLIFCLLLGEDLAARTYRDLASVAQISRGAVGYVMGDLQRLGFIEKVGGSRRLRNRSALIDRWTAAFAERLRPRLLRGRYQFVSDDRKTGWKGIPLRAPATLWGGEPAADLLTDHLRPGRWTVYTRENTSAVCRRMEAVPDPEGPIDMLDLFWDPERLRALVSGDAVPDGEGPSDPPHVPPLLVYADLIAGADPRGLETADLIYETYLADEQ